MSPKKLHKRLVEIVGHHVKNFRKDLLVHDLNAIQQFGAHTPFMHFAYDSGTNIIPLPDTLDSKILDPKCPEKELRLYLIAASLWVGQPVVITYYDGRWPRQVSEIEARTILNKYRQKMLATV